MPVSEFLNLETAMRKNRVKRFERKIILDDFLIGNTSTCSNCINNYFFIRSGMKRERRKKIVYQLFKEKISIGLIKLKIL